MTKETYHGLTLDNSRTNTLSGLAVDLLRGFYMLEGETIQQAFARPALAYCLGDKQLAQDIYDDVSRGWAMYSSPIQSNAPSPTSTKRNKAQPISCFLGYVPDNREGLVDHQQELAWLSMMGGGFGGHWGDVRAISDKSVGPMPHIKITDSAVEGFRQGKTRKGSYAAYLDITHPDVVEFLHMRLPTGGDINRKCFNVHHAVNITDDFMGAVFSGSSFNLVCPSSNEVRETVDARELWQSILEMRFKTGEPYLNFIDTANRGLPEAQKALGLKIHGSNLCNEIHLATDSERTAVCCLSSVNLAKYDEWKHDTKFIGRWVRFLDNVLELFIYDAPAHLRKAVYSAKQERAIGLGQMGFHHLLQSRNIAWETPMAKSLNTQASRHIHEAAIQASLDLGAERGEAPDMKGTGRRNSHVIAVAPNANSGLIAGTSPSREPQRSNAFTQRTRAGSHLVKNPYLQRDFDTKFEEWFLASVMPWWKEEGFDPYTKSMFDWHKRWIDEQWQLILLDNGSVQSLPYMSDYEKEVYKTSFEIDMRWVVSHAADAQPYICQGQSVNLYFPFGADRKYINEVHLMAYQLKLKGLYYLRTTSGFTADKVSVQASRVALKDFKAEEECLACQG